MSEQTIGKVSVRVYPDTRKFRKELKRELDKIEKQIECKIEVKPILDEEAFRSAGRRASQIAQQAAKNIELKVDLLNRDSITQAIKRIQSELNRLDTEISIPVDLEETALNAELARLQRSLDSLDDVQVQVDAQASTDSVTEALDRIQAEIAGRDFELRVTANTTAAQLALQALKNSVYVAVTAYTNETSFDRIRETFASLDDIDINVNIKVTDDELDALKRRLRDELQDVTIEVKVKVDMADTGTVMAAIAELQTELNNLAEVEIPVKLDTKGVTKDVVKAVKRANKAGAKAAADEPIMFSLQVNENDQGSLASAIAQIQTELAARKFTIEIEADDDSLNRKLDELTARLEQIQHIDLQWNMGDSSSIQSAIAEIDRELNKLTRQRELSVKLNADDLRAMRRGLEKELTDSLTVDIEVDPSSQSSIKSALAQIQSEIDKLQLVKMLGVKPDFASLKAAQAKLQAMVVAESLEQKLEIDYDFGDASDIKSAIGLIDAELKKLFQDTHLSVNLDKDSLREARRKLEKELADAATVDIQINPNSRDSIKGAIGEIEKEIAKLDLVTMLGVKPDLGSLEAARAKLEARLAAFGPETIDLKFDLNKATIAEMEAALSVVRKHLEQFEIHQKVALDEKSLRAMERRLEKDLADARMIDLQVDLSDQGSLKQSIAKLKDELEKINPTTNLHVKLNERDLKAQIASLEHELDFQIQAKLDIDHRSAQRLLNVVNAQLSKVKISPKLDKAKAAKVFRELELLLIKASQLHAQIQVEIDPVKKRQAELEMKALGDQIKDLKAELDPRIDRKRFAFVAAALKALGKDRKVSFKPVLDSKAVKAFVGAIDRLSLYRAGRKQLEEVFEFLGNLDLMMPKIAKMSLAIAGLGATALAASAQVLALAVALGQIVQGAVLAAPGLLISAGVAVGVLVAALKDFKTVMPDVTKKFSQLQDVISKRFWAEAEKPIRRMVNTLFPQLQRGVSKVATAWGKFFASLSQSFAKRFGDGVLEDMFSNVAKAIDNLTEHADSFVRILRVLGDLGSKLFIRLTKTIGTVADKWAKWLETAEKTGELDAIIERAIDNFLDLLSVLGSVYGIFRGIARAAENAIGGPILDKMAKGLKKVQKVVDSAEFQKELTEVFEAADKAMSHIAEKSGPALKKFFKNLGNLLETILPDAGSIIGNLLGGILDALNQPRLLLGVRRLFDGMQSFARDLRPAFKDLGDAVGSVLDLVGTMFSASGPFAASGLSTISGWIKTLADGLRPLVRDLIPAFGGLLDAISPAITKVVDAVADFAKGDGGKTLVKFFEDIKDPMGTIADVLGDLATEAIKEFGKDVLPALADTLKAMIDDVAKFLTEHKDALIDAIHVIGVTIREILRVMEKLSPIFTELVTALIIYKLAKHFAGLAKALKNVYTYLKLIKEVGLLGALFGSSFDKKAGEKFDWKKYGWLAGLGAFLSKVAKLGIVATLVGYMGLSDPDHKGVNIFERMLGLETDLDGDKTKGLLDNAKKTWADITGFGEEVTNWFKEHPSLASLIPGGNGISGWLNGEENGGGGGGTDVDRGWFDSLGPSLSKGLLGALNGLTGTFVNWKPLFEGDWKTFFGSLADKIPGDTGQEKLQGILKGLGDKVLGHIPIIGGLWDQLWARADTSTKTGGENIQREFSNFLGGIVTRFVNWIPGFNITWNGSWSNFAGNIKDTLVDAGVNLIQGLIDGINQAIPSVKSTLETLTSWLPDWKGPASKDKVLLYDAGALIIDGFVNGLESRYKTVKDSLGGLTRDIAGADMGTLVVPTMSRSGMRSAVDSSVASGSSTNNTLNYYAAPGSSISAEEDLFAAAARTRMGW